MHIRVAHKMLVNLIIQSSTCGYEAGEVKVLCPELQEVVGKLSLFVFCTMENKFLFLFLILSYMLLLIQGGLIKLLNALFFITVFNYDIK